jgi:ribosomal protein S18 acetylase RimI-like enzyme
MKNMMAAGTINFKKMSLVEFSKYRKSSLERYAQDIARNFKRPFGEVQSEARKQVKQILKDGLSTRGHFLYNVFDMETSETVGFIWFKVGGNRKTAFLYDIFIHEPYRGKGFGKQSLVLLERTLRDMGVMQLGLHVFGHNQVAINLYKTRGFYTASFNMQKDL